MFPNVYNQSSSDTINISLETLLVKYFEIQCKLHEKDLYYVHFKSEYISVSLATQALFMRQDDRLDLKYFFIDFYSIFLYSHHKG